ncbi:hypothetical protein [Deminuibacter soli]|uniref:Uncharacterized protein n=1 Tax=Deminuibacter soli TaxID=2291815 RepID=A0A3E1NRG8_9BACT|nr:hypothetical protein [Deminuibacter soli]RFM30549.1 hypothetical protein DXN05_06235 [Deminuibacter soli]
MATPHTSTPNWSQRNWLLIAILTFVLGLFTARLLHIGQPAPVLPVAPAAGSSPEHKSDSAQKPYETFGNDNTGTNK